MILPVLAEVEKVQPEAKHMQSVSTHIISWSTLYSIHSVKNNEQYFIQYVILLTASQKKKSHTDTVKGDVSFHERTITKLATS